MTRSASRIWTRCSSASSASPLWWRGVCFSWSTLRPFSGGTKSLNRNKAHEQRRPRERGQTTRLLGWFEGLVGIFHYAKCEIAHSNRNTRCNWCRCGTLHASCAASFQFLRNHCSCFLFYFIYLPRLSRCRVDALTSGLSWSLVSNVMPSPVCDFVFSWILSLDVNVKLISHPDLPVTFSLIYSHAGTRTTSPSAFNARLSSDGDCCHCFLIPLCPSNTRSYASFISSIY